MSTGTTTGRLDSAGLARSLKQRVKDIDRELAGAEDLLAEKERIEAALARLDHVGSGQRRSRETKRPGASGRPGRAPRGQSRQLVLSFMAELGRPATATEVSNATGLKRSSVSTLLSALAKAGKLDKRERGYALPDGAGSS